MSVNQVIPHLSVSNGEAALAFYEQAFGATTNSNYRPTMASG